MVGWVLLGESALSFLGLGVRPPAPTWGNLLAASRAYMESAAWLSIAPGICIALTLSASTCSATPCATVLTRGWCTDDHAAPDGRQSPHRGRTHRRSCCQRH